ncbi:hypothetical protein H1S01_13295 [Heliobacterium chlorum]|uniref:Uncharacterized protein n=1 Tax=Heliobacterium chlorum TaxID=2698 RepID=A0ABR7T5X3_HELCL|nr:hypothetical protein [Heliobacterium chlorum]MBC9785482.1 hypothetical protein [Heliobacterium chlorum]
MASRDGFEFGGFEIDNWKDFFQGDKGIILLIIAAVVLFLIFGRDD